MKLLEGKTALITGGSRGIGRQIALTFADHGADVAFTYHSSAEKAKVLVGELEAKGVKAFAFQSDASDPEAAVKLIEDVVEALGSMHILVNNAGITKDTLIMRMSVEQWQTVIDTNLNSAFYTIKAAMRTFLRQRAGSIINMSSVVGLQGNAGQSNYAASKAGLIGFTKSVAREIGSRGVRANIVAPGFIATEMTHEIPEKELETWLQNIPLKRAGSPEDVANLCVFLGSDLSTYMTGQVLNVDGGMVMY